MACPDCNREKGGHPHVRWGGQMHYHEDKFGNRYYCSQEHQYCVRLDCNCGRHGPQDGVLAKMGVIELRGFHGRD